MNRSELIDFIKAYVAKVTFGSTAMYQNIPVTANLIDNDIPSWKNIKDYSSPNSIVNLSAATNDEAPKVLSSDELASVNALSKLPNMVVTGLKEESTTRYTTSGFTDVTYDYEGSPGNFTYFSISLHNDGNGHNLDAMNIQLS